MSRVCHTGVTLAVVLSLTGLVCAQNRAQGGTPKQARVQHVAVRGNGDAVEVEIQTSGALVAPNTQAIIGPDRIVVDFPGALPDAGLRALNVNRGALKGVRSGLFSNNPPITRLVLDLTEPRSYQVSTIQNGIVVKLNPGKTNPGKSAGISAPAVNSVSIAKADASKTAAAAAGLVKGAEGPGLHAPKLQPVSLGGANASSANAPASGVGTSAASTSGVPPPATQATPTQATPPAASDAVLQQMPFVAVTFVDGMLRIHADKATLAQVLFEVQRQTQAEIGIPAGAEREQVIADLGPAPARDVLAALLNGSPYNFIFVGHEQTLERVILTLR